MDHLSIWQKLKLLKNRNKTALSFLKHRNVTFWNKTLSNTTNDFGTTCPAINDEITEHYAYLYYASSVFIVLMHIANIASIAMNRRLHQNVYFLLLNLSVSDLLTIACSLFLYTVGVSGT